MRTQLALLALAACGAPQDTTTTGTTGTTTETSSETTSSTTTGETSETSETGEQNQCPRVRITVEDGNVLNVRPTPASDGVPVGVVIGGTIVDVTAIVDDGQEVEGTTTWYLLAEPAGYVTGAYADCTTDTMPAPDAKGFWLPLECGTSATVSQGNFGDQDHQGDADHAFDFDLAPGTPMVAMADGSVLHIYDQTGPGDPCHDGGDDDCAAFANLVVLLHGDGTTTLYKHLGNVSVGLGDPVGHGQVVGLSGATGFTAGPHAHVMRMTDCGSADCPSLPLEFLDAGVPTTGQQVTSMNCI